MSTQQNESTLARILAILLPVVVGGLLGLTASLSTTYYTSKIQRSESIRKERAQHIEHAMGLASKFTGDLSKVVGFALIGKGKANTQDTTILNAPTDTLMELKAAVSLHFPKLGTDVDQIIVAYGSLAARFDDWADGHDDHRNEDSAAFQNRIQKEVTPVAQLVHSLMTKLGDLSQTNDAQ
jgi:hypothetical protein